MSNFPIQFTNKVNSPELLAIMQQFGEHTYVDAELINKFRDALNELHARTADTRIVENTGLQIVGTDVVINELWKWLILSVLYSNDLQITLPITLSSEGNQKLCYLCANQDNGFELVYGPESETNPVAPTIPDNLLYITFFLVTDGTVGTPAEPIVGDIFKKKSESAAYNDPTLSGSNAVIQFQPNGESVYAFSNAGLVSIDGFGLDLITGNPSAEVPYPGKDIFIFNNKSGNLTLKHDGSGTAQCKFFFIDETDLIIPPGGKVWIKYGPSYCEIIFKSWGGIEYPLNNNIYGVKNGLAKQIDTLLTDNYISGTVINSGTTLANIGSFIGGVFTGTHSNYGNLHNTISASKIVSANLTGSVAGYYQTPFRGVNNTQKSKFKSETYFSFANTIAPTASRMYIGFSNQVGSPNNIEPTSIGNIMCFYNNSADSYLSFRYMSTSVSMGTLFPARFAENEHIYQCCFYFLGDNKGMATIRDLVTGNYWESGIVSISFINTNSMRYLMFVNNNTTDEVVEPIFVGQINKLIYGL